MGIKVLKFRETNGKTSIVIVILVVMIIVLGVIFALKVMNKPEAKELSVEELQQQYNEIKEREQAQKQEEVSKYLNEINKEKEKNNKKFEKSMERAMFFTKHKILISIISFGIGMVLCVGASKLYKKMGSPDYITKLMVIYPIVNLAISLIFGNIPALSRLSIIQSIWSLVGLTVAIGILYYYYQDLDMSGIWAIVAPASMFVIVIGMGFGQGISPILYILVIAGIVGIIASIVAHVKASLKLADMFSKGKIFKAGLILLPFIFQPILGFQREQ